MAVKNALGTNGVYFGRGFTFPHWLPALLFAILPARWLVLKRREIKRNRIGRCPSCGYDLRATPGRCPECGRSFSDNQISEVARTKTG